MASSALRKTRFGGGQEMANQLLKSRMTRVGVGSNETPSVKFNNVTFGGSFGDDEMQGSMGGQRKTRVESSPDPGVRKSLAGQRLTRVDSHNRKTIMQGFAKVESENRKTMVGGTQRKTRLLKDAQEKAEQDRFLQLQREKAAEQAKKDAKLLQMNLQRQAKERVEKALKPIGEIHQLFYQGSGATNSKDISRTRALYTKARNDIQEAHKQGMKTRFKDVAKSMVDGVRNIEFQRGIVEQFTQKKVQKDFRQLISDMVAAADTEANLVISLENLLRTIGMQLNGESMKMIEVLDPLREMCQMLHDRVAHVQMLRAKFDAENGLLKELFARQTPKARQMLRADPNCKMHIAKCALNTLVNLRQQYDGLREHLVDMGIEKAYKGDKLGEEAVGQLTDIAKKVAANMKPIKNMKSRERFNADADLANENPDDLDDAKHVLHGSIEALGQVGKMFSEQNDEVAHLEKEILEIVRMIDDSDDEMEDLDDDLGGRKTKGFGIRGKSFVGNFKKKEKSKAPKSRTGAQRVKKKLDKVRSSLSEIMGEDDSPSDSDDMSAVTAAMMFANDRVHASGSMLAMNAPDATNKAYGKVPTTGNRKGAGPGDEPKSLQHIPQQHQQQFMQAYRKIAQQGIHRGEKLTAGELMQRAARHLLAINKVDVGEFLSNIPDGHEANLESWQLSQMKSNNASQKQQHWQQALQESRVAAHLNISLDDVRHGHLQHGHTEAEHPLGGKSSTSFRHVNSMPARVTPMMAYTYNARKSAGHSGDGSSSTGGHKLRQGSSSQGFHMNPQGNISSEVAERASNSNGFARTSSSKSSRERNTKSSGQVDNVEAEAGEEAGGNQEEPDITGELENYKRIARKSVAEHRKSLVQLMDHLSQLPPDQPLTLPGDAEAFIADVVDEVIPVHRGLVNSMKSAQEQVHFVSWAPGEGTFRLKKVDRPIAIHRPHGSLLREKGWNQVHTGGKGAGGSGDTGEVGDGEPVQAAAQQVQLDLPSPATHPHSHAQARGAALQATPSSKPASKPAALTLEDIMLDEEEKRVKTLPPPTRPMAPKLLTSERSKKELKIEFLPPLIPPEVSTRCRGYEEKRLCVVATPSNPLARHIRRARKNRDDEDSQALPPLSPTTGPSGAVETVHTLKHTQKDGEQKPLTVRLWGWDSDQFLNSSFCSVPLPPEGSSEEEIF